MAFAPGAPHPDEAEHHAGEAGDEVQGPASLRPGRLPQHRQDSRANAAGRVPAARQRAHARRPAARGPQLGSGGGGPGASSPRQQRVDPAADFKPVFT